MDNSEYQRLRELAWRKGIKDPLEPIQSQQVQQELREERQLTRCLNGLVNAPVSSNFTARVLQAAIKPAAPRRLTWWQRLALPKWAPRLAMGALMVSLGVFTVQQYKSAQNMRRAQDLASVSQLAQLSDVDWLDNFETINRMSQVQAADDELLNSLP